MIDQQTFQRYATSPVAFRNELLVDVDGEVRKFGNVQDPWQRKDFASLDPAWLRTTGRSKQKGLNRAYFERGRGHSKTTDLAVMTSWTLAFATRPLKGYAFAADRDQAGLLRDAMLRLTRLNPWLGDILSVESHRVVNKAHGHPGADSTLEIAASDVGSSYGILPDFIIVDELTHWQENAAALWESIISSAAKRSNCVLAVIANAGFRDSWQWNIREAIRTNPTWVFSRLNGPVASWLTEDRLDEQRKLLPPIAFARLWGNEWSTGGGDALTEEDINAAFKANIKPMPSRLIGWEYVAGLDLGVSRDASAIVVLGVRKRDYWDYEYTDHGRVQLVALKRWKPTRGQKVNLQEVEDTLLRLHLRFDFGLVGYDPWQATHLAQRLALSGLPMLELTPTSSNLQKTASAVIEAFADRRVDLYENEDLRRDLKRLRVEEKSYGFRLTSPRDEHGHGDTASAFGNAILAATEKAGAPRYLCGVPPCESMDGMALLSAWQQMQEEYQEEMRLLRGKDSYLEDYFGSNTFDAA